jgi:drug/metabolite transporter (DMT)-like permease
VVALLYALICLIWGSTWLFIKVGLVGVPPFLGAGLRFLISAAIVGVMLAARRTRLRSRGELRPAFALTRDDKICIASLALLVFWLDYALVYWAEVYISSGLTAVLFSTMPLMTALMAAFWTRSERLTGRKIAGIVVGAAGTLLLFWPSEHVSTMTVLGMLAALGGSLTSAINLVMLKKHGGRSDPFVLNFFGMGIGTIFLLAMSAVLERGETVVWTRSNVIALLYLALLGSVAAFSIYYYLIKRMDATIVSLTTLIIPIVALALGRVFLDEQVTRLSVAGIVTVLAGVAIAANPGRRAARPEPAAA